MNHSPDTATILIVDDTPSNLGVVVSLFEKHGYHVSVAQDGEEGLQRAGLVLPDLILLDVMLPGADGFEVCRMLKAQECTRDIPVIFMTSLASLEHKVKGFQAGGVDYVTKPMQFEEVMARVETQLSLSAMRKKLEEQNAELQRHREELEQRVEERTAELAAREREFRTLVENLPDGIIRLDTEGRHLFVNEVALHSAGLVEMDLLGKTVCDLPVPGNPETLRPLLDELRRAVRSGKQGVMEFTWPNGRVSEICHIPEFDGQGDVVSVLAIARDITERKRAEQQLTMLGAAIAKMHEAAYFVDGEARIFYVNDAASRQLGYSRDEFLGMTVMDIAPGWTKDMVANVQQRLGENEAVTFEAEHRRKDGGIVPVEINVTHLTHDGKAFGLAMVRDITERKRAEEALAVREREFRTLAENAPDNIARHDQECRFIYVNPQFESSVGKRACSVIGKTPVELNPGNAEIAAYQARMKVVIETGQLAEFEAILADTDDGPRFHNIRLSAERDAAGGIVGVLAIGRDVTQRKQAERELVLLNRALDNAFDATYLIDEELRFRYVNEAAARALGYSREELLSMSLLDVDPNITREMMREMMEQTVAGGSFRAVESAHRRKNGEIFPVEVGATAFIYEGETLHLTTVRDISDRKQAERELEESRQQLRQLAARREEVREEERKYIAREVHDELGQILTGLQLDVSMLDYKFGRTLPELHEHLKGSLDLVNKSLATARNVASALRPASLDMGVVAAIEWVVGRFASNTGLDCEVHVCEEARDLMLEESTSLALFRITQESLTNIARHARANRVSVNIGIKGGECQLEIRDNGKGIDMDSIKEGSFGLVGIRERVHMLGGKLAIQGEPGMGTVIEVRIPVEGDDGGAATYAGE